MPRSKPSSKKANRQGRSKALKHSEKGMKRWETIDDIPLDEEDQFHSSRDKILLEGDEYQGDGDDGDGDEVFALKGMGDDEESDEDEDDEEYDEELGGNEKSSQQNKKSKSPKQGKSRKKGVVSSSEASEEEEEEEESWGKTKAAYYSSNAGAIESDDEEANALEEAEARRLQLKTRAALVDDDFGLLDKTTKDLASATHEYSEILDSGPEGVVEPEDLDAALRYLERTSPETLALARDWEESTISMLENQNKLAEISGGSWNAFSRGMIHLSYQTQRVYATTLAFYFYARATPSYIISSGHPVLKRLLTMKQALLNMEELELAMNSRFDDSDSESSDLSEPDSPDGLANQEIYGVSSKRSMKITHSLNLRGGDFDQRLKEQKEKMARLTQELALLKQESTKPSKTSKVPPKKKRKTDSAEGSFKLPKFDLEEPTYTSKPSKPKDLSSSAENDDDDPFGDPLSLHHTDVIDKNARRKSLRFHTSKIEGVAARREGARRSNLTGDDDIPYRERRKEKEARESKEREKRKGKLGLGGDDLEADGEDGEDQGIDDGSLGKGKRKRDSEADGGIEDDEGEDDGAHGYYDLVKRKSKEAKERKREEYEAVRADSRPNFFEDSATGQRSVTRAILTNKGLTPHRSKSVRNPRVKKRQKFEKAKRKVASQRAVYKAGSSDASKYVGEKSGISKVVKSVKLG